MLDVFTRTVLSKSGLALAVIPEDLAILLLGTVVERGKGFFLEAIAKEGILQAEGEKELRKLICSTKEGQLFVNPFFSFSLHLGIIAVVTDVEKTLDRELNHKELWAAFKIRLEDIFSQDLADRLFEYSLHNFPFFKPQTPEEWKKKVAEHFEFREKTWGRYFGLGATPPLTQLKRHSGTETWLEPCPKCGLKKRCDKNTKNFRCNPPQGCGFNKPYPFPSA